MTSPSPFQPDGWPRVHAYLQADGTGAITVDGNTSIVNERRIEDARQAILAFATDTARRVGAPVRMTSTDPDGQWWLVVGPDGSVQHEQAPQGRSEPAPEPAPVPAAEPEPAPEPTSVESPDEADDWPDPGVESAEDAVDAEETPAPAPWDSSGPTWLESPADQRDEPDADDQPEPVPARAWQDEPEPPPVPSPADSPTEGARRRRPADAPALLDPPAPAEPPALPDPPAPARAVAAPLPAPWQAPVPDPAAAPITGPAPVWPPQPSPAPAAAPGPLPTLHDLLDSRPAPPTGPAEWGWQGAVRRLSFGAIKPRPGPAELQHRSDVAAVQRSLAGPRTIVVVNPKGGAHKTTATMLIAATFGLHRGGYTLAWDNNETRGTLGWRAVPARHTNTAVNLLADLERFDDPTRARIGDLDNYVRSQGSSQFDVLASDEDARASASIDANAFRRLHAALSRFYRIMIIDTGNNMRASNWGAALEAADQLVIVSTVREDTAASAAWLVDGLRSRLFEEKVANAVMLLSAPGLQPDPALRSRLHTHFGQLTRAVIDVPYDPALVDGAAIDVERLQPGTREAWLHATAVIAEGL